MHRWSRPVAAAAVALLLAAVTTAGVEHHYGRAALALEGTALLSAAQPASTQRPNIVLVLTDDMRDDDLEHMPITQQLLVAEGTEFTDAISPHPLCCPARAILVTGQYAQNNGVQHNRGPFGGFDALDPTRETSAWFRGAGYQTGFVGKFLNGYGSDDVEPSGWMRWDALQRGVYSYTDFTLSNDGSPESFTDSYVTDVIARRTNAMVRDFARTDAPFLVYSWHLAPHYRIGPEGREVPPAPPEDQRLFSDASPPSFDDPAFNEEDISDQPAHFSGRSPVSRREMVAEHRARLRSLQSVDRAVGSLVNALEEEGVLDDTVIVFTSDNGFSLGEHRHLGKDVLSREPLQVPLVVRGPGVGQGVRSDLPASLVDVPVTLAAMAGISPGWVVDGTSLVPSLRDGTQAFRDTTLVQTGSDSGDGWGFRGVRTGRYLYGVGQGEGLLYDNEIDPHQVVNRYDDPSYAAVRAALEVRRTALLSCAGWTCNQVFGPLPDPVEPAPRDGG